MPTLKELIGDLDFITDRLSTQVRTVALGLAALSWGLLLGESQAAAAAAAQMKLGLLLVGTLAVVTLLFDFSQYVFAFLDADRVRKEAEDSDVKEAEYDYETWTYRLRSFFFWGKQVLAGMTAIVFVAVVGKYLVRAFL